MGWTFLMRKAIVRYLIGTSDFWTPILIPSHTDFASFFHPNSFTGTREQVNDHILVSKVNLCTPREYDPMFRDSGKKAWFHEGLQLPPLEMSRGIQHLCSSGHQMHPYVDPQEK